MTSTDVVYAGASLRERQDYALALSKAGELIPRGLRDPNGQPNPGKILLVTEYGNALHIHPIVALNGIDIIEGNLTITPALMSGLVRERGHKLRVRTDGTGQALTATATLVRADDPQHPFEVTWSMADAKAAGLDNKQNWKKYPRAMLKARAISEVCREGAEDVLMGAYVPEELGATVNEAGEVIDAEIVELDQGGATVGARGRANETRVTAASDVQRTRPRTGRPGGGTGAVATPPAPAEPTRDHADVYTEWADQVTDVGNLDALIRLHDEAANRHVLDHRGTAGDTLEERFLARRQELLDAQNQAAAEEPTPAEYDDETPF